MRTTSCRISAHHRRPSRPALVMAVVFAGDQMSMPREQGVRADNGADFPEHPPRQELSFGGQANALIVGEAQPARAELRAEHAILGLEIVDHVALLLVDPARQGHNEELERIREPSQELSVSEERSGLVQVASSPGYISQARSIARISTPIELLDTRGSRRRYARFVTVLAGGCADNGRPCVPKWRCRVSAIRRGSAARPTDNCPRRCAE